MLGLKGREGVVLCWLAMVFGEVRGVTSEVEEVMMEEKVSPSRCVLPVDERESESSEGAVLGGAMMLVRVESSRVGRQVAKPSGASESESLSRNARVLSNRRRRVSTNSAIDRRKQSLIKEREEFLAASC